MNNSLGKLFGASKGVNANTSDFKAPTTRQSVKRLAQLYMDRSALYPRPTRADQCAFFDSKIRTIIKEKQEGTQAGKTLEDVIRKLDNEISLLDRNLVEFKEITLAILDDIRRNPQAQIPVADINPEHLRPMLGPTVEANIDRSRSMSDLIAVTGDIRDRAASVVSDSDMMSKTSDKLSKLLSPEQPTMMDTLWRGMLLAGKDVVLAAAESSSPMREMLSQQIIKGTVSISLNTLFPKSKTLDLETLERQTELKNKLASFLPRMGNEIMVTEDTLRLLKHALEGLETRVGQTPENSRKLLEEETLLRNIQSECKLKLAIRVRSAGILEDVMALNRVLPTITSEDLAVPLKLVSKMLVSMRDNPDLRNVLRDIFAKPDEQMGLRSLLEAVKGPKVALGVDLFLKEASLGLGVALMDTLQLSNEEHLWTFLTDPVAVLLADDVLLGEVIDILLRYLPNIMNDPENFQLLLALSRSEAIQENRPDVGLGIVGTFLSVHSGAVATTSPVAQVVGAAATLLAVKMAERTDFAPQSTLNIDQFSQQISLFTRGVEESLLALYMVLEDAPAPQTLAPPKTEFEAISNLILLTQSALTAGITQVGKDRVTGLMAKEVSKMVAQFLHTAGGTKATLVLDKHKVAHAKHYSMMLVADFVGKNPFLVDVLCNFGASLIGAYGRLGSPEYTPVARRDMLISVIKEGVLDIGCVLRGSDSPLANQIADALIYLKMILEQDTLEMVLDKSGIFGGNELGVIKPLVAEKVESVIRTVEHTLIRMVAEKLNPPPPETLRPADQPFVAEDPRLHVSLDQKTVEKLNGEGFLPKGMLARNVLYGVGLLPPLQKASDNVLGMVNALRL